MKVKSNVLEDTKNCWIVVPLIDDCMKIYDYHIKRGFTPLLFKLFHDNSQIATIYPKTVFGIFHFTGELLSER